MNEKYTIMLQLRALSASLVVALLLLPPCVVKADDLKDIAQQANQGQQDAALDRINAHLAANPKDVQAMFMRAVILAEQNRRDEAIKAFTEISDKYPTLPEPYNNLAVLYADQGQYEKAKKALESAIKTNPSYSTAHENLGDIYAKMASEAYGKALQLDGGNTRAQGKLSMIRDLFSSGKPALLANRTPSKEPVKAMTSANVAIKPIEPAKPAEPKSEPKPELKSDMRVAEQNKGGDTVKTLEAAKPADSAKTAGDKMPAHHDNEKDVENAVNQWAHAWSSKNVDAYLASYADSFKAPDGQSRKEWEKTRRTRIDKHEKISVEITKLNVKVLDDAHAQASFKQGYISGSLAKKTSKVLVMKRVGDKWLIEQELAS